MTIGKARVCLNICILIHSSDSLCSQLGILCNTLPESSGLDSFPTSTDRGAVFEIPDQKLT